MSGFGSDARTEDLGDTTQPGKRGTKAASATATVEAPIHAPPIHHGGPVGVAQKRGPVGAFETTAGAKGSDLLPEFGKRVEQRTRRFWIGTLPSCPKAVVHLGGQDFPDYCDPEVEIGGGQRRRAYQLGVLRDLTDAQIERIREAMKRRFVRGDAIYCIPTASDVALLKQAGRPVEYPESGDDALARHVYMVETGVRGDTYPPSVYETGVK